MKETKSFFSLRNSMRRGLLTGVESNKDLFFSHMIIPKRGGAGSRTHQSPYLLPYRLSHLQPGFLVLMVTGYTLLHSHPHGVFLIRKKGYMQEAKVCMPAGSFMPKTFPGKLFPTHSFGHCKLNERLGNCVCS